MARRKEHLTERQRLTQEAMRRLHNEAIEREQRICFGIAWFATEQQAVEIGALIRRAGFTYNGGWSHGARCGRASTWDRKDSEGRVTHWAATY